MDRNSIKEQIKQILITTLSLDKLPEEIDGSDLHSEFSINSIDAISIFITIENTFNISIEDEDLNASLIASLDTMSDYIIKKAN